MSRAVLREAIKASHEISLNFYFSLPSFTVEYATRKSRKPCECDQIRRQSPPTFSAGCLCFAGHSHHKPEGQTQMKMKPFRPSVSRKNSVNPLTFLNKSSLVGIVYIATTAAFLITHGWCNAKVLLYASWQQRDVLSTSERSFSRRKNSLIKSRKPEFSLVSDGIVPNGIVRMRRHNT